MTAVYSAAGAGSVSASPARSLRGVVHSSLLHQPYTNLDMGPAFSLLSGCTRCRLLAEYGSHRRSSLRIGCHVNPDYVNPCGRLPWSISTSTTAYHTDCQQDKYRTENMADRLVLPFVGMMPLPQCQGLRVSKQRQT